MTIRITLAGSPPRTKKNSPQIIRGMKHPVLVPSEAYTNWFRDVLTLKPQIHSKLPGLPIEDRVSIAALVYRDRESGDWTGYADAIADAIQVDVWSCLSCKTKHPGLQAPAMCACGCYAFKHSRKGLGIIVDDRQIAHWDGTRLCKDAARPRVQLTITTIPDEQGGLF